MDISRDNIQNRMNGACERFLNYRKKWHEQPKTAFNKKLFGNKFKDLKNNPLCIDIEVASVCDLACPHCYRQYISTPDKIMDPSLAFKLIDQALRSIKDIKIQILDIIEKSFKGNQNLKKLIEGSAFCSDKDEIISENYKINENQKIGIIPPIGGG